MLRLARMETRSKSEGTTIRDESRATRGGLLPSGWKFGTLGGVFCAAVVFFVNLMTLVTTSARHEQRDDGSIAIYEGSCEKTRRLNVGIHALINILATALLSSSNYCMQCLSAPTREDVDKAHARRKWLDIGVLSVRNLGGIPPLRVVLWSLLAATSIPIHLFFNSVVYRSISATEYTPIFVTDSWISLSPGENYTIHDDLDIPAPYAEYLRESALSGKLEKLDAFECLSAYGSHFLTSRGAVLVVTDDIDQPAILDWGIPMLDDEFYSWVCGSSFNLKPCMFYVDGYKKDISSWKPFGREDPSQRPGVAYCYSELVEENCRLNLNVPMGALVTAMSFVKGVLILAGLYALRRDPLITVGDAIASFTARPDVNTRGMCMASRVDIRNSRAAWPAEPKPYMPRRWRWARSVGLVRWIACIALYILLGIIVGVFLHLGISRLDYSTESGDIIALGLGTINPMAIIKSSSSSSFSSTSNSGTALSNAMLANVGQVALSFIYFTYNGLFTAMFLSHEWSTYGNSPKGVRVSSQPVGDQRSTYFLQVPYRIAIPLMAASAILHWLLSQAIFLVSVEAYATDQINDRFDAWERLPSHDILSCGYSPLAMVLLLVVGVVLLVFLAVMSSRRLASGMPVAGSCSAAISAACHLLGSAEDLVHASERKLQWGVEVWNGFDSGHCSLSPGVVCPPQEGRVYA